MKHALLKAGSVAALLGLAAAVGTLPVLAQTPAAQKAAAPAIKRMANGKPDLSGTWTFRLAATPKVDPRGVCAGPRCGGGPEAAGLDPGAPAPAAAAPAAGPRVQFPNYKPEFKEQIAKFNKEQVTYDPALRCGNPGIPRVGTPDKIIQTPDQVVFLYDDLNGSFWRIIPTTAGVKFREDAEEGPMGDSIGRWEGDKLIIETQNLGEDTWLTDNGAFHTYKLKTVEEVSLNAQGGLDYKFSANDPDVLAEPFVKTRTLIRNNKELLQPPPCVEQSIGRMTGIESYHANPRW